MYWVEPDSIYQEEAEGALNLQFDKQMEEFFFSDREKVNSSRMAAEICD